MKMKCTENAELQGDWDLSIYGDGDISVLLPYDQVNLGCRYYEQGGMHVVAVKLSELIGEYIDIWKIRDDKEDATRLANELIELGEKLKESIKHDKN